MFVAKCYTLGTSKEVAGPPTVGNSLDDPRKTNTSVYHQTECAHSTQLSGGGDRVGRVWKSQGRSVTVSGTWSRGGITLVGFILSR